MVSKQRHSWVFLIGVILTTCSQSGAQSADETWKREWQIAKGFALSIDTEGFSFPTSIAFVPNPGPGPKDPLYFVTELLGKIKVVTNDRTIYTFAENFFDLLPAPPPPKGHHRMPEIGMVGLCLDAEHGYVFVSFTYHNQDGEVKNNFARLQSTPGTFSLKHSGIVLFTEIFSDQPGSESHMIGPMLVHDGLLYVNVGDAGIPALTQDVNYAVGKILRMTLDGKPAPDNPYYQDDNVKDPANFVYAYGLRNPFGSVMIDGRMFVNDNGPGVDRFVRIREGRNYGYDGTDWSICSHADVLFTPSVSPVGLTHLAFDSALFPPEYRGRFYAATSGLQGAVGPSRHGEKAVLMIDYDHQAEEIIGRPHYLLKYTGRGGQMPVDVEFGPDGLYMIPFDPDRSRSSVIYKITHDPSNQHPFLLDRVQMIMQSKGCNGCHRDAPDSPGPLLDRRFLAKRVLERLQSQEYMQSSLEMDKIKTEPFVSYREQRKQIREAEGLEKVRAWLFNRLLEPRFDQPDAQMPQLGLTTEEAALVSDFLVEKPKRRGFIAAIKRKMVDLIPKPRQRHLLLFFVVGSVMGCMATLTLAAAKKRFNGRGFGAQIIPETSRDAEFAETSAKESLG